MVDFLKYRFFYFTLSFVVIAIGLFSILRWGFTYSIDFVGGTILEYQIQEDLSENNVRSVLKETKIDPLSISSKNRIVSIRTNPIDEKKELELRKRLEVKLKTKVTSLRFETVGPLIGEETVRKTIIAAILGISAILLYMSFAFRGVSFALAAILALIHDLLVLVGIYSILSHFFNAEVDLLFVTAVLTTMSFSVHDTIVIFDKIREYVKTEGKGRIEYFANKALTETMVRSLNNSMTIVFMLLALILLGGSTIRFFIIALLIGTITGTYSSPFIATPILVWLEKRKQ